VGGVGERDGRLAWVRRQRHAAAWLALAGVTVVGGTIRFAGLGRQSFWLDESVTASLLERPLVSMLRTLPSSESAPPLYYVVAWGWSRLFGLDPVGVRSLSALAGTLTIPVAYAAGTALVSRRAGLATASVACVSPVLVWFSQEARAYALLVLFSALSLAVFGAALKRPSAWALSGWVAASALALLTHYFAVFLVAAEAIALLVLVRPRRAIAGAVAAISAVGLALVPLVAVQSGGSATWIRGVDLPLRVGESLRQLALPQPPPIWAGADVSETALHALWPVALVVVAASVSVALAFGEPAERRGLLVALGIGAAAFAVPLGLALVGSAVAGGRGDFFLYRNVIVAWLPVAVAVAGGLTVRRAGAAGVAAVGLIVAASCAVLALTWADEKYERDDLRRVASAVSGPRRAIVLSPSWQADGLLYHAPRLTPIPETGASIDEIDVAVRDTVPSYSLRVERFEPPRPFELVARDRIQHWTVTRYRAPRPFHVRYSDLRAIEPPGASAIVLVSGAT
jgi:4-amino-4-deoxy-L-arabinose transferase-like glycosyltransferase